MKYLKLIKKLFNGEEEKRSSRKIEGNVSSGSIKAAFEDCYDFDMRRIRVGSDAQYVSLCFIDGLVSGDAIADTVIRPLTSPIRFSGIESEEQAAELILSGAVFNYTARKSSELSDVLESMLNGFCALVFDGCGFAVVLEVKSTERRSISEPKNEKAIKGSKDSFVETLKVNSCLARRHLRSPDLKLHETTVGDRTGTKVCTVYIDGLTNKRLVEETIKRIESIDIDGLLTTAELEEYIADNPKSPFPQLMNTERPDRFCMNLLEGRVGILIDGIPLGFLAPGTFAQFFKVSEDRANHFLVASGIILLRYIAFLMTLLLPAFFVAAAMYHQEMLPTKLLQSMIDAKQSVPFSLAMEALAMLGAFELIQEAGMRLPAPIGETVSIIGGLIVGQSAVEAKVISPIIIIVIALTGIAGYTIPNQDMGNALRLCRFLLVLAAIVGGFFGVTIGTALLVYHLCSLESLGVAYMTPVTGKYGGKALLQLLRPPLKSKKTREAALETEDRRNKK